jgi:hypothetical protein
MAEMELLDELPSRPARSYPNSKVDWELVADTARANPGKWVQVPEVLSSGMLGNFRRGKIRGLSPDEFEMRSRSYEGKKYSRTFYVRVL